jgi:hypothetical protein
VQSCFCLQEEATIHGKVQTLEILFFLKKANILLYVREAAEARTPFLHRSMKVIGNPEH